jgi:hypothetical protein
MENSIVVLIVALIGVFVAWKMLKGIVKTVALLAILAAAAAFAFGGGF